VLAFARMGAVSVLAQPVGGFALSPEVAAEALRAATVSGIALHGPGLSPLPAQPWDVAEVAS
jgi:hypothetical protein